MEWPFDNLFSFHKARRGRELPPPSPRPRAHAHIGLGAYGERVKTLSLSLSPYQGWGMMGNARSSASNAGERAPAGRGRLLLERRRPFSSCLSTLLKPFHLHTESSNAYRLGRASVFLAHFFSCSMTSTWVDLSQIRLLPPLQFANWQLDELSELRFSAYLCRVSPSAWLWDASHSTNSGLFQLSPRVLGIATGHAMYGSLAKPRELDQTTKATNKATTGNIFADCVWDIAGLVELSK